VKTLTLDLETSPNVAHVWGLWNQNVGLPQLRESGQVISFAAKWLGSKKVEFYSDFHDGHEEMVKQAWRLVDEADAIVTFNGKSFDMKWLNREFIEAGLNPPSAWRDIDLLLVARKQFRFPSNKLQYVSTKLGLDGKVQHSGHDLWVRCLAGDEKAWATMRRYNRQDVVLTEELYVRLLPWITNHPNAALYVDADEPICPRCESTHLQKRGYATTQVGKYRRFQCTDCGGWAQEGRRVQGATIKAV
jgi:hypothetical protein